MKTITYHHEGTPTEINVTFLPISNPVIKSLPQSVQDTIADLFVQAQSSPKAAIPVLKKLIVQYPQVPQLYNFITTAYSLLNDYDRSEQFALEGLQKHPDYLFIRINYAEICLKRDMVHKVPVIFEDKLNLPELLPDRKVFHLTEVVGFLGVCGRYYHETKNLEAAKECYRCLSDLSPESPKAKTLRSLLNRNA